MPRLDNTLRLKALGYGMYRTRERNPFIYAFLEESTLQRGVMSGQWYRCSRDGEPDHPVRFKSAADIDFE